MCLKNGKVMKGFIMIREQDDLTILTPKAMIKLAGGLLLIIGMMLSSVKWNPINGKMAGHSGTGDAGCHINYGRPKEEA